MKKMGIFNNTKKRGNKYTIICDKGIVYQKVNKFAEKYIDRNEILEVYSADEFNTFNYISSADKIDMFKTLEMVFEDFCIKFISNNMVHIYNKKREA